jgi:GrpB-like predicted nucleotidyltransferase (UPF0157 family)
MTAAGVRIAVVEREELDRHLDKVLIGGREPADIRIVPYDPAWPERFLLERDRIAAALGDGAGQIEHIGSTSVPGLAAKPVIDIIMTVADLDDDAVLRSPMEGAGYVLRVLEPDHRMFRTPERDVHVHVVVAKSEELGRHLLFRDRLRANDADREAYEALKRELATRSWTDVNHYANAKGELIEQITQRARTEAVQGR